MDLIIWAAGLTNAGGIFQMQAADFKCRRQISNAGGRFQMQAAYFKS